jgi:hypothetical protein
VVVEETLERAILKPFGAINRQREAPPNGFSERFGTEGVELKFHQQGEPAFLEKLIHIRSRHHPRNKQGPQSKGFTHFQLGVELALRYVGKTILNLSAVQNSVFFEDAIQVVFCPGPLNASERSYITCPREEAYTWQTRVHKHFALIAESAGEKRIRELFYQLSDFYGFSFPVSVLDMEIETDATYALKTLNTAPDLTRIA